MEVKTQAERLIERFNDIVLLKDFDGMYTPLAIECAKIAVDELINYIENIEKDFAYGMGSDDWQEVKDYLERL